MANALQSGKIMPNQVTSLEAEKLNYDHRVQLQSRYC